MKSVTLIKEAKLINENKIIETDILIENQLISKIESDIQIKPEYKVIYANGNYVMPGVIDDQVHFREPGLIHKADIYTEAKAAIAGGITSFMEMPNTNPQTLTQELLEEKYKIAAKKSLANFSFYMGASNDNIEEVLKTNQKNVCGVKVFMGSSTGNMLVDNEKTLHNIFSKCNMLIATHCEDESTVQNNLAQYIDQYGEDIPIKFHPKIRSEEACYISSSKAVEIAKKYNTRLHILHISTAKECDLFSNEIPIREKKITSEACIHHLWFHDAFYDDKKTLIKWNPAVKTKKDRDAILEAVISDKIDVIATDHAPHTLQEKSNIYTKAPSGGPLVQHALLAMLELYYEGKISLEKIVDKMSHKVADCFQIEKRGYIREGYFADIVIVSNKEKHLVTPSNILYKCGWSPFENQEFNHVIKLTMVNGNIVYHNEKFDENIKGMRLTFDR